VQAPPAGPRPVQTAAACHQLFQRGGCRKGEQGRRAARGRCRRVGGAPRRAGAALAGGVGYEGESGGGARAPRLAAARRKRWGVAGRRGVAFVSSYLLGTGLCLDSAGISILCGRRDSSARHPRRASLLCLAAAAARGRGEVCGGAVRARGKNHGRGPGGDARPIGSQRPMGRGRRRRRADNLAAPRPAAAPRGRRKGALSIRLPKRLRRAALLPDPDQKVCACAGRRRSEVSAPRCRPALSRRVQGRPWPKLSAPVGGASTQPAGPERLPLVSGHVAPAAGGS
jgi:hypothetical protein